MGILSTAGWGLKWCGFSGQEARLVPEKRRFFRAVRRNLDATRRACFKPVALGIARR